MVSADRIEKKNTGHSGMRTGMTTVKYQLRSLTKHYNQQLEVKLNLGMWMQGARRRRNRSNLVGCEDSDKLRNEADASLNSISY